jgi:hypothetical protein
LGLSEDRDGVNREHVHGEVHALDGARRRVIVAIAAEDRDPAFREQLERRRVQSCARLGGVPRPERLAAGAMADPDKEQVTLLNTVEQG